MSLTCIVCSRKYSNKSTVTFHRFPRNPDLKISWLRALRLSLENGAYSRTSRICSKHFKKLDFHYSPDGRVLLKRGAVPKSWDKKENDDDLEPQPDQSLEKSASIEYIYDKAIIVNLEHAYASTNALNAQQFEEVIVKTEENEEPVMIKTEEPSFDESTTIDNEEIDIKPEPPDMVERMQCDNVNDNSLGTTDKTDPLSVFDVNYDVSNLPPIQQDQYMLIEKVAFEHIQNELWSKNNTIVHLTHELKQLKTKFTTISLENENLRKQLEFSNSNVTKVLDTNKAVQKDYDLLKKHYGALENQMSELTTKMIHYMNTTLPQMFSENNVLSRLKSQVERKDLQIHNTNSKIKTVAESMTFFKDKVYQITERSKLHLLQSKKHAEESDNKYRFAISNYKEKIDHLKKSEETLKGVQLQLEKELSGVRQLSRDYKTKLKNALVQREISLNQNAKLRNKLLMAETRLSEYRNTNEINDLNIRKLSKTVEELKNRECQYCGG